MMRFFISLFIFVKIFAFANVKDFYEKFLNEKEPNALFDECIDLINGNLAIEDEFIANGKEPIKIKKSQFSLSNFDLLKREEKDRLEFVLAGFSYKDLTRVLFYKRIFRVKIEGNSWRFTLFFYETFSSAPSQTHSSAFFVGQKIIKIWVFR